MTFMIGCEEEAAASRATTEDPPAVVAVAVTNPPPPEVVSTEITLPIKPPKGIKAATREVAKLLQGGVEEGVIKAYIENSPYEYKLSPEDVVYLSDLGLSAELLTAMLKKGETLEAKAAALANQPAADNSPTGEEALEPLVDTNQTVAAAAAPVVTNVVPLPATAAQPTIVTGTAPVVVPAPAQVVVNQPQQVNYFYESLSPYGTWVEVDGYGWCWQPTVAVVNVNWRPYADRGRWLYTDCGWYWQSDYSWGWAPFHYGRWHRHARIGWVWTPDTKWGPAWVTWRYSNDYCGWAPLPPGAHVDVGFGFRYRGSRVSLNFDFGLDEHCYTFIPSSRFCDRTPWNYCVTGANITHIYRRTTVINNYTFINNGTIINNGIDRGEVAKLTRSEIRQVAIRDMNPREGTLVRPDRLERDGSSLAVYRPNLPPQAAQPPKHVARRDINTIPSRVAPATPSTASLVPPRGELANNSPRPSITPGAPKYEQQPRTLPATTRPGELPTVRPTTTAPKSTVATSPSRPTTIPATPSRPVTRPSDGNGSVLANTPRPLENAPQQRPLAQPSRSVLEQPARPRPTTPTTTVPAQIQPRTTTTLPQVQTYPAQPSVRSEPRRLEVQPRVNTVQPPKYSPPQQVQPSYTTPRSSANFESRGNNTAPQVRSQPSYSAPQRSAPTPAPQAQPQRPAPAPSQSGGNAAPSSRPSR